MITVNNTIIKILVTVTIKGVIIHLLLNAYCYIEKNRRFYRLIILFENWKFQKIIFQ